MLGTTEGPSLWSGLWIQVLQELILPLVASLANQAANAGTRCCSLVHKLLHVQGVCTAAFRNPLGKWSTCLG